MVLRLDDTDVERNTEASVQSIFEGLRWLGLTWDEEYKQSERLALHRQQAEAIFEKDLAYRDFTPAHSGTKSVAIQPMAPTGFVAALMTWSYLFHPRYTTFTQLISTGLSAQMRITIG